MGGLFVEAAPGNGALSIDNLFLTRAVSANPVDSFLLEVPRISEVVCSSCWSCVLVVEP